MTGLMKAELRAAQRMTELLLADVEVLWRLLPHYDVMRCGWLLYEHLSSGLYSIKGYHHSCHQPSGISIARRSVAQQAQRTQEMFGAVVLTL